MLFRSSLGTWYDLNTRGSILFLEDVDERPYRLDSMLTHLRNAGRLDCCSAILLGYFTRCEAADPAKSQTVREVIAQVVEPVCRSRNIPLVIGLPCGHSLPTMSLPLGAEVQIDAGEDGTFSLKPGKSL